MYSLSRNSCAKAFGNMSRRLDLGQKNRGGGDPFEPPSPTPLIVTGDPPTKATHSGSVCATSWLNPLPLRLLKNSSSSSRWLSSCLVIAFLLTVGGELSADVLLLMLTWGVVNRPLLCFGSSLGWSEKRLALGVTGEDGPEDPQIRE